MDRIQWKRNTMAPSSDKFLSVMDVREIKKAKAFHESFPQYSVTPLVSLEKLASHIGVDSLFVKDESYRFGLNAFKVLGGSYAMAKYVAQQTGKNVEDVPYDVLTSPQLKEEFGQATFFTATDGNHGRGVAWAANKLGQKAVVFMPKGSTEYRRKQIENEGATVTIEEFNYDECVRLATKKSKEVTINNCRFYNVSSTISNELKYQNNEIYVTDKKNNIIKLYDIIDDKVLVNKKTLYKIENGEIKLDEYKVHHALRFYVIDEQINLNSKIKSFVNGNGKTIDELLFTETKITKDKSYSIIFALELNEEAMKLDNLDYSYCYSYQSFFIDSIIADVK